MILNELPLLDKNRTCAVTGHRFLMKDFDEEALYSALEEIIKDGYTVFLIGMALGFDTKCFQTLEKLKKTYPEIKLTAVIPCINQAEKFTSSDKKEYDRMVGSADYKVILEKEYTKKCMFTRNDFLVENSSLLLAYYKGLKRGGTFYTLNRAKNKPIKIVYFGE